MVHGPLRSILTGERSALNFLGHLSGIATLTRAHVEACGGRAPDPRHPQDHPGAAVPGEGGGPGRRRRQPPGKPLRRHPGEGQPPPPCTIAEAVDRARARWPGVVVEVECDTLDQLAEAKAAGADLALLDNMTPDEVAKAVALAAGALPLEVSGRVTLETVAAYAAAGADLISIGALTHSAPVLDIALDLD